MTKEETEREIQRLWMHWPGRKKGFKDIGIAAFNFMEWLKESNQPVLSDGDFGYGDKYQHIHGWVLGWMAKWGRNQ